MILEKTKSFKQLLLKSLIDSFKSFLFLFTKLCKNFNRLYFEKLSIKDGSAFIQVFCFNKIVKFIIVYKKKLLVIQPITFIII